VPRKIRSTVSKSVNPESAWTIAAMQPASILVQGGGGGAETKAFEDKRAKSCLWQLPRGEKRLNIFFLSLSILLQADSCLRSLGSYRPCRARRGGGNGGGDYTFWVSGQFPTVQPRRGRGADKNYEKREKHLRSCHGEQKKTKLSADQRRWVAARHLVRVLSLVFYYFAFTLTSRT
jgi:hypothetical protein